jgi:biotin-dependent carboxylase-like uncharacterized protein
MNKIESSAEIVQPGLLCSIQDHGRKGYASWGVPYSGAMDSYAYRLANSLLGNEPHAACLEIGPAPIHLRFHASTVCVSTGAQATLTVDGKNIRQAKPFEVHAGSLVKISNFYDGNWLYLGVKGGFQTPIYLESHSWSKGISAAVHVKKGMLLPYTPCHPFETFQVTARLKEQSPHWITPELSAYRGADWKLLPVTIQKNLANQSFELGSAMDRMGYQLLGLAPQTLPQLLTAPVFPGTVQLTPSGKMIVLMREAQVTGGYPRILQLTEESINRLSQKKVGSRIRLNLIDEW